MTIAENKLILSETISKINKAFGRKEALLKEVADDKATLELITEKEANGDPMPGYSPYTDFNGWKKSIQKEISRSETTLANLDIRLVEAEAYQYYIDNFTE